MALCRASIVSAATVACMAVCPAAPPQEAKGDSADWAWLRSEATAALVAEPPRLKGVERWFLESPRHRGPIICMCASPDGSRAATGGTDGTVRIWNLETGTLEKALAEHRYHVYTMDWSPDGTMLATHSWYDASLCVWDVATGRLKKRLEQPQQMRSLRWSRDSRKLAGCTLGSGRISVIEDLAEPKTLKEMGQPVAAIDWSPDATRLAVVCFGNAASLVNASSGASVTALELDGTDSFSTIRFSPDGAKLTTSNHGTASIWDAASGKRVATIKTPVADLAWSPDGKQVATVSSTGLKFWNSKDGTPAGGLVAAGSFVDWTAAPNGIVVGSASRVEAWAVDATKADVSINAGGSAAPVFQAGKPVVTGIGTNVLSLWDPVSFKRLGKLEGHAKPVTVAAWSLDGKRFASGSEDGTVRMWDVKTFELLHECVGHKGSITGLEWSPDGKMLASLGDDKTARIWSAEGVAKGLLEGHTSWIDAVAWSPNGKQVVTGGRDKSLIVWNAAKMTEDKRIEATVPITSLAWSAVKGSPALACGFQDGAIRIINPSNGDVLATVHASSGSRTNALGWMPGNRPMLLATRYYLTQMWDISDGKTVQRQIVPGGATAVGPTAGGSLAMARAEDRTVRFWEPTTGKLRGLLLEEGDALVAISTDGNVKCAPEITPGLIAIVETQSGQKTMPLDELATTFGWKNNAKMMKLPTRN